MTVNSKQAQCQATTKSGNRCKKRATAGTSLCAIHSSGTSPHGLRVEYDSLRPVAERFAAALQYQLESLIKGADLTLGVPIERRVKDWKSISEKLERKQIEISSVGGLDDFVGLRLILLFTRDLDSIHSLLSTNFSVLSYEDTASRLQETQFGYQSVHYIVRFPDDWLSVPTMSEFKGLKAELQVRTLAQHMWAAASHKLQYKRETSVPVPLRRSIHRVSAILETVDLEFERLLGDREAYVKELSQKRDEDRRLNVDILEAVLASKWPKQNAKVDDSYAVLLEDLASFGIETESGLNTLIDDHYESVLAEEMEIVLRTKKELLETGEVIGTEVERIQRGVYFTYTGLTRCALQLQDEDTWQARFMP